MPPGYGILRSSPGYRHLSRLPARSASSRGEVFPGLWDRWRRSSRIPLVIRTWVVRVGLAALAVVNAWWGAWAYVAPRNFFDSFPGFGHHWTAAYPPYNEHLITDLGATFLTLAALLATAAVLSDRRIRT